MDKEAKLDITILLRQIVWPPSVFISSEYFYFLSFAKFDLWSAGSEVLEFLQYTCSNDIDIPVGTFILSYLFREKNVKLHHIVKGLCSNWNFWEWSGNSYWETLEIVRASSRSNLIILYLNNYMYSINLMTS